MFDSLNIDLPVAVLLLSLTDTLITVEDGKLSNSVGCISSLFSLIM